MQCNNQVASLTMKLNKVLLRWYKSFHLNYRGYTDRSGAEPWRPWNRMSPDFAADAEFPFIEIPVERDITTVVGGNESGKSHLLNAISKVVTGHGIESGDEFRRTDLCHYAGIRTKNVEAWPNIGCQFVADTKDELSRVVRAAGLPEPTSGASMSFAVVLAPEGEEVTGYLFVQPEGQKYPLTAEQLGKVRKELPKLQFIDSRAMLSSEITISQLLSAYRPNDIARPALFDRRAVASAVQAMRSFTLAVGTQVTADTMKQLDGVKQSLSAAAYNASNVNLLELQLFRDILGITGKTLEYIDQLQHVDRGYVEGQVSKWNEEINERLNLTHFWRQDDQFALRINYKDGIVYFEIQDKTDSIYTFRERSSGLKYFLSYYIQAKALETSRRTENSIILMDEPDSALSVLGQKNLLSVFESLVSAETSHQSCQLIYTTHSPYLINRNFPRRIRVVKKEDAEEGTQYIEQARARRYEPVRTALGVDSASSLFLGAQNVLLEGATDQFLFAELVREFARPESVGEFLDLNGIVLVSADGVGNIESVLTQSRWGDEPIPPTVVIVDDDDAGRLVRDRITGKGRAALIDANSVTTIADLVKRFDSDWPIVTTEDILPNDIYKEAIRRYFRKWLVQAYKDSASIIDRVLSQPDFGKGGIVEATKELFRIVMPAFDGDYDKMGVFQEAVAYISELGASPGSETYKKARDSTVAICDFIRAGLDRSVTSHINRSAAQAIKRIVSDFLRLNKGSVAVTAIQKVVGRIEREVANVGDDASGLVETLRKHATELERLRRLGQERVVKDEWRTWERNLVEIKSNPFGIRSATPESNRESDSTNAISVT